MNTVNSGLISLHSKVLVMLRRLQPQNSDMQNRQCLITYLRVKHYRRWKCIDANNTPFRLFTNYAVI